MGWNQHIGVLRIAQGDTEIRALLDVARQQTEEEMQAVARECVSGRFHAASTTRGWARSAFDRMQTEANPSDVKFTLR